MEDESLKKYSYDPHDFLYGTAIILGVGPTRDVFNQGAKNLFLPKNVDKALEDLLAALHEETGNYPRLVIYEEGEFNPLEIK